MYSVIQHFLRKGWFRPFVCGVDIFFYFSGLSQICFFLLTLFKNIFDLNFFFIFFLLNYLPFLLLNLVFFFLLRNLIFLLLNLFDISLSPFFSPCYKTFAQDNPIFLCNQHSLLLCLSSSDLFKGLETYMHH